MVVVIICPMINTCYTTCRLANSYLRDGFSVLCLSSQFFSEGDIDRAVNEFLSAKASTA